MPTSLRSDRKVRAALLLLAGSALALPLGAQPAAPADAAAPTADEVEELQKFIVTGSNIPTAADAIPVPVTIIGPAELEATGINANLLEVLRKRLPFFAGNGNLGNTNANVGGNSTLGGSQVSLRNLDTLVLINGRRIAFSGANGRGGRNFVDVNQIPLAAVESIEVLKDGASAIYGSDAVGGVVNIKLKSRFTGVETGGRFASADGGYTEQSAYLVAGDTVGPVSLTASISWSKTDPLYQADRPFSATIIGRTATISGAVGQGSSFPTAFLNPALSSPSDQVPTGSAATSSSLTQLIAAGVYQTADFASIANTFDLAPHVTLLLDQEQVSGTASIDAKIFDRQLEFFGDVMLSNTKSFSQLAAQPTTPNITVPAGAPYNPLTTTFSQVAFRYTPAPRQYFNDAELLRATAGFRGEFGRNYRWEAAYTTNQNENTVLTKNVLYAPNVNRAVAGGYNASGQVVSGPSGNYSRVITGFSETAGEFVFQPALDPFARPEGVDPASLEHVLGTARSDFESQLDALDLRLSGEPVELPGGALGVAIGGDFRWEELGGTPDENTRNTGPTARRWLGATFFDPFSRKRDISAAFVEVRAPVFGGDFTFPGLHSLDLTAAYRYEDYSDAGESDVPKYGLRWQPFDEQLTLRYTYSEAFSAPSLYALYGPVTQGFTATNVIPSVFTQANGTPINGQAQSQTGSNPTLRPSTAETHSFGFVVSPKFVPGLTVSVNYVDIDQADLVGGIGTTEILSSVNLLGPASPYHGQVAFNAFPGATGATLMTRSGELQDFLRAGNSANLIYVFDGNVNIAGQKVRAIDLEIDYETELGGFGDVKFSSVGTFFLDYQFQALPSQPYHEYASITTNGGTGSQGTIPGYRFYNTIEWSLADFALLLGHTYIPSVDDLGPGGNAFVTSTTLQRRRVESYTSFDLSLSYTLRQSRTQGWLRWWQGAKFTVGVNNVADELPPLSPQAWNESNVDIGTYGVLGRVVFGSVALKF